MGFSPSVIATRCQIPHQVEPRNDLIRRCGAAFQSMIETSAVCLKADRQTNGFAALPAPSPEGKAFGVILAFL